MSPFGRDEMAPQTVGFAERGALLALLRQQDDAFDWDGVIASYRNEVKYRLTRGFERALWDRAAAPWLMRQRWRGRPIPTRQSMLEHLPISTPPAITYSVRAAPGSDGTLCADISRQVPSLMPTGPAVTETVADRYATLELEVQAVEQDARTGHERATDRLTTLIAADAARCDEEDEQRELSGSIAERLNRPA